MKERVDQQPEVLTVRALATQIRRRELSAVEALDAALARIEARNPDLNAVVALDAEGARSAATAADAKLDAGADIGPLHGVPITIKDGHDIAGLRTTVGTEIFDRVAEEDGTVAARLRAAGSVFVGHTNVPPLLADYQTANPIYGRTNNPWHLDRTPGGSSGGAAAAVAAGLTPFDVGSDLTGSLRLPAHFCGVYGLKTTEHRIPLTGFFRQPSGTPRSVRILSTLGPIARDLDDLDLVMSLVAGPDGRDPDIPPVPYDLSGTVSIDGLRVAVGEGLPGASVGKVMQEAVAEVASRLATAGAHVQRSLPDVDWGASNELFMRLLSVVTSIFAPDNELDDEQRSVAWYLDALDRRDQVIATWETFFEQFDVLIVPPAMTPAFPHADEYASIEVDGRRVPYLEHGALLIFANLTGLPALSAPAAIDADGLPIGIQLVGSLWSDARLIGMARAMEEAGVLPGFRPPPERAGGHPE
jgi:amidase